MSIRLVNVVLAGRAKNTLCSRKLVPPSDSPCYGLNEINSKAKSFGKYLNVSTEVKGAEIKGAERR